MSSNADISVRPKVRSQANTGLTGESLEKRSIRFEDRDGVSRFYPALHNRFSHSVVYHKFRHPPTKSILEALTLNQNPDGFPDIQEWFTDMQCYVEILSTLLKLPHNK